MRRTEPKSVVQSVERALEILSFLAGRPNGTHLTFISKKLGVSVTTAHRLLSTLMAAGFVIQDGSSRYRLGFKILELSSTILNNLDIRREAASILKDLSTETGEVVHLGILSGDEVIYIDKVESFQILKMSSAIGFRAPLHCTGLGKALMAFLPDSFIEDICHKGLKKYTENTITSLNDIREEMSAIRSKGYAIDDEEHEPGIRCLSAPVFNHGGSIIASLSVAGPSIRMTIQRLHGLVPTILSASNDLSRRMGWTTVSNEELRFGLSQEAQ